MKLTAELSLYPLQSDYIPAIQAFIDAAREHDNIKIVSNAMSTQICGDYERVFSLVQQELKASYKKFGMQVLVCKFIPAELDIQ
ncbi:MAG: YkoF family thiamine/hydroxymethylpyrimidine-binding protein [Halioglobus sp.]